MRTNNNIYSVRQINSYIKGILDEDFLLNNVNVSGEISNCHYHYSGHIYFSLKDESAVLNAVMFSSYARGLKEKLSDGMKVVVNGNISVYERDGRYQLYAKSVERQGIGDLYKAFEELKLRLAESGMFDAMYKKPIPAFSYRIGVVTAQTGAVIRDIYNVSSRRNPFARIVLYPASVQGEGAAETIISGIKELDKLGLDVIIIGRGGGSIEDLWCFNDERLARTIFEAETPVISAVGHETDFTISDFAADLRAPTPSAAAELAVFDYNSFINTLSDYRYKMQLALNNTLKHYEDKINFYQLRLDNLSPENKLTQKIQFIQDRANALDNIFVSCFRKYNERLIGLSERLEGLSPLNRLSRGWAYVSDKNGSAVRSTEQVENGDIITVSVTDGEVDAQVVEKRKQRNGYG